MLKSSVLGNMSACQNSSISLHTDNQLNVTDAMFCTGPAK
jgi:hypothetical protein